MGHFSGFDRSSYDAGSPIHHPRRIPFSQSAKYSAFPFPIVISTLTRARTYMSCYHRAQNIDSLSIWNNFRHITWSGHWWTCEVIIQQRIKLVTIIHSFEAFNDNLCCCTRNRSSFAYQWRLQVICSTMPKINSFKISSRKPWSLFSISLRPILSFSWWRCWWGRRTPTRSCGDTSTISSLESWRKTLPFWKCDLLAVLLPIPFLLLFSSFQLASSSSLMSCRVPPNSTLDLCASCRSIC